jgi:hypothetical protein
LTHCQQLILFLISRDESDEESEEEKEEGWGKKKAYWSGDTADLEIGQDVQDAEDEEEAAEVSTHTMNVVAAGMKRKKLPLTFSFKHFFAGATTREARKNARK